MPKPLEMPGPGEQQERYLLPESASGPIPEGAMPAHPADTSRPTETSSVLWRETAGHHGGDGSDKRRSTSTDQDALPAVRLGHDMPERRLDRSADDLPRETAFDPAQDDSGPR